MSPPSRGTVKVSASLNARDLAVAALLRVPDAMRIARDAGEEQAIGAREHDRARRRRIALEHVAVLGVRLLRL
jgi:hypothetical protein